MMDQMLVSLLTLLACVVEIMEISQLLQEELNTIKIMGMSGHRIRILKGTHFQEHLKGHPRAAKAITC